MMCYTHMTLHMHMNMNSSSIFPKVCTMLFNATPCVFNNTLLTLTLHFAFPNRIILVYICSYYQDIQNEITYYIKLLLTYEDDKLISRVGEKLNL